MDFNKEFDMNNKILNLLKSTAGALGFSLFCGLAYFFLVMYFVLSTTAQGALLLFFIGPAVICGAALVVIKLIKQNFENENEDGNLRIFYLHFVLFIISAVFACAAFV